MSTDAEGNGARPDPRPRPAAPDGDAAGVTPSDVAAAAARRVTDAAASVRRLLGRARRRPVAEPAPDREPVLVGAAPPAMPPLARQSVFDGGGAGPHPSADLAEPEEWVRVRRNWGPLRRAVVVLVVIGLIFGVSGAMLLRWIDRQVHPAGPPGDPVEFTIEPQQTTNVIASNLASKRVIANATVFRYWLRRQGGDQTFQAGKYDLFERMDYPDLLQTLRDGPKPPVFLRVTIPPGLTLTQIERKLVEQLPSFNAEELHNAFGRQQLDAAFAPALPLPAREGLFFPDTYNVDDEASGNEFALLKRMRDQMDKVLQELKVDERAVALGRSTFEVLTVASLIEEEAKIDTDRPKIARVIYNRLDRNMALGIDATTRYAVGKLSGEPLTQADLDDPSPFNTRKSVGLPPTPIAAPSKKSIEAALSPTPGEKWLYYVLTDEGGVRGAHTFVNTAREFEAAKKVCADLGYCG